MTRILVYSLSSTVEMRMPAAFDANASVSNIAFPDEDENSTFFVQTKSWLCGSESCARKRTFSNAPSIHEKPPIFRGTCSNSGSESPTEWMPRKVTGVKDFVKERVQGSQVSQLLEGASKGKVATASGFARGALKSAREKSFSATSECSKFLTDSTVPTKNMWAQAGPSCRDMQVRRLLLSHPQASTGPQLQGHEEDSANKGRRGQRPGVQAVEAFRAQFHDVVR
ncbi:unnamed protein product [Symbiodinium natans]|uniref:Uncharacterized protein n=1 Tax=Symbiodinium natans TaxID=878477 RepID=A0A812KIS0_9DINO|nr:unnamed protein product [Symbiodinium natans]